MSAESRSEPKVGDSPLPSMASQVVNPSGRRRGRDLTDQLCPGGLPGSLAFPVARPALARRRRRSLGGALARLLRHAVAMVMNAQRGVLVCESLGLLGLKAPWPGRRGHLWASPKANPKRRQVKGAAWWPGPPSEQASLGCRSN